MGLGPLRAAARGFGEHFERRLAPELREAYAERFEVAIDEQGQARAVPRLPGDVAFDPQHYEALWSFLLGLGVRRLTLDLRLESNQIADVVALLMVCRRRLQDGRANRTCSAMCGPGGVSFACTRTQLVDGRLTVDYSYCLTRFSRFVEWFKRRRSHLQDHRALFRAAPRYGLALTVLVGLFFIGSWLIDSLSLRIALATVALGVLFGLTYLFFMTVGSVEYDNEEKAYRLERTYRQLHRYTDRVRRDLSRARNVQKKLLPDTEDAPLPDRLEWAWFFDPEAEVGGDYFDLSSDGNGTAEILFTDVSGHGMSSALITAIIKTHWRHRPTLREGMDDFLKGLNRLLCELTPDDSFAAACMAVYDAKTGRLRYINCGHRPEPILVPGDGAHPIRRLSGRPGMLLGVAEEVKLPVHEVPLVPGDKLLFVTDGIIEATDASGGMFGTERLEAFLAEHRAGRLEELVRSLKAAVSGFTGGAEQSDDQTVLAFRVLD